MAPAPGLRASRRPFWQAQTAITMTDHNAPTADERIQAYLRAVRSIREGVYDVDVPVGESDPIGILGMELQKLAETLEQHFDQARKLQRIAEEVTGGLLLDDVLDRVYQTFRQVIPYNRIGCALLSSDHNEVTAFWGRSEAATLKILPGYTAPLVGSSLRQILESGEPRILNDLEAHLERHPDSVSTRLVLAEGIRSSLTCPLIAQGKPIGFLFFSSFDKNTYQDLHQGVFLKIAAQLSMLIEKSRLYQEILDLNRELITAQHVLENEATHDALTGVFNRKAIDELLQMQLARSQRLDLPLAVAMVDVDLFKQFNDIYGHLVGDQVLQAVAACLSENLRDYTQVGRFGGEEFLVLMSDVEAEAAAAIAERLCARIGAQPFRIADRQLTVTVSIGVAFATRSAGLAPDNFVAQADAAMYRAKAKGRNQVEFHPLAAPTGAP